MTKSTITREQLIEKIKHRIAVTEKYPHLEEARIDSQIFKISLAAMDSEPVALTDEQELRDVDRGGCGYLFTVNPVTPHADERRIILLYRHAQPAPVIPDGSQAMLRRWLAFGRGMQNAGSQLPHNLIAETEAMLAAAPQEVK
ncbi:hypothetical protein ACWCLK_001307 [Klebsiella pneumoniae]|nr:hypothetical protein [Klebsiella pneumoniae]